MAELIRYDARGLIAGPRGLLRPDADGVLHATPAEAEYLDARIESGHLEGVQRLDEPEPEPEPKKPAAKRGRGKATKPAADQGASE